MLSQNQELGLTLAEAIPSGDLSISLRSVSHLSLASRLASSGAEQTSDYVRHEASQNSCVDDPAYRSTVQGLDVLVCRSPCFPRSPGSDSQIGFERDSQLDSEFSDELGFFHDLSNAWQNDFESFGTHPH